MSCESVGSMDDLSSHDNNARKRVGKACDRCRLKKSKCDGSKPCGRCKADNQLCLFGERKKAHDKIYPKGYVELLEHQQALLVNALQLVYRQYWSGPSIPEVDGYPLVHDLLENLGLLQEDTASSPVSFEGFHFEEHPEKMQARLAESEGQSQSKRSVRESNSPASLSPVSTQPSLFRDPFSPMQPSTPQDQQLFPTPTSFFPYPQSPTSMPIQTQLFQLNHNIEQLKQAGMSFPTGLANSTQSREFDAMDTFSGQFPMLSTYNDMNDFVDEDPFGPFVNL